MSTEQEADKALDLIHDIAAKASLTDGIPPNVEKALDDIIALSRYKFDVLGKGRDQKPE